MAPLRSRSRAGQASEISSLALTFDDISLMPRRASDLASRRSDEISLHSQIARTITLNIPVLSSYMDTVTEATMAIAMARFGGIGILHRWMTIQEQVEQVNRVKRSESRIIRDPYTLPPSATVSEIKKKLKEWGVGTVLIVDSHRRLLGIVSTRDVDLQENDSLRADSDEVMTPRDKLIVGPPNITIEEAKNLLHKNRIENIPLVDHANVVRGLVSKKDLKKMENELAVRDANGQLLVGASIGLSRNDLFQRTGALIDAGADFIVLAIANGYLARAVEAVRFLRKEFPQAELGVGCTTEYEGTKRLFTAGADTVLVGIGPGSICETRKVAGVGVPQFTALRLAQKAAREDGKFIICDGGVHEPHHFVKALVAGASAVLSGTLYAGTNEAPGEVVSINGQQMKMQRGLASDDAKNKLARINQEEAAIDRQNYVEYIYRHVEAEGVESGFVPYTGSVAEVVRRLTGGLRSAMTYLGVRTIPELWDICEASDVGTMCTDRRCLKHHYVRVTAAGDREGSPHHVDILRG